MTDVMQGLVSEAKNNKYSTLRSALSDEDIVSVWENVSGFIDKQMSNQKAVCIPGLGTFTFSQKKLDVGNNKYLLIQRPIFLLSEKFAQTHQVHYTKYHVTGQIPVVQLNFSALSFESPFDRDTVESCVKEVLQAMARSVGARRNVEFTFQGIGRLQIRNSKVKMKFYKDFINSMDGSGQLVNALKDRPNTMDSVMSDRRGPSRAGSTNTLILPSNKSRIPQNGANTLCLDDKAPTMPTITETEEAGGGETAREYLPNDDEGVCCGENGDDADPELKSTNNNNSRPTVAMAKASGVSFGDEYAPDDEMPLEGDREEARCVMAGRSSATPMIMKRSLSPLQSAPTPPDTGRPEYQRSRSLDVLGLRKPELPFKMPSPPGGGSRPLSSACGHQNSGQELCYLCHQRDSRNVHVSFADERKHREREEERLLKQYQQMRDTEAVLKNQEGLLAKRHESQKLAAFNLGVAEAVNTKKKARDPYFHASYLLQKRPLTPSKYIKQQKYLGDLHEQVNTKCEDAHQKRSDEAFLERLEQVQLAEDLAVQRDQYMKDKADQTDTYKRALSAQVRFKPLPLPKHVPDSDEPVFGKNDMNASKMADRRRVAHDLFREQVATVEMRKREAILRQLADQKEDQSMISRTRQDLREDRADRYDRFYKHRKRLETDWASATLYKKEREYEDRKRLSSPGALMHEQCDKYKRCDQCRRHINNCGESNIWRDTRYIPGTRIMV